MIRHTIVTQSEEKWFSGPIKSDIPTFKDLFYRKATAIKMLKQLEQMSLALNEIYAYMT